MKQLVKVIPVLLALFVCACGQAPQNNSTEPVVNAAETKQAFLYSPQDPSQYKGMNYEEVGNLFWKAGFANIIPTPVDDIDSKSDIKDGAVESVTVNGSEDFTSSTEFEKDAEVKITYHNVPKIEIPVSSEEASLKHYMEVGKQFFDAGFKNIETDEVYDLPGGESSTAVISANGEPIENRKELPFDEELSIVGHYPVSEYPVTITIDFKSNWIFDKYDVKATVDGSELGTMPHGEGNTYSVFLPAGNHTVLFASTKDTGVTGTAEFSVDSGTSVSYRISCEGKEVKVQETGIDHALKSGQILMPFSSYHFMRKNYEKAAEEFKALGFSNVKTEPVSDHYWKPEEMDHTVKVEINGKSEFNHDDIFNQSDAVVVYYHAAEFAFDEPTVTVTEKDTFDLKYTLTSDDPLESIPFETDNPKVLQKNEDGTFTAQIPGTATVSAYLGGGNYSSCEVEVKEIVVPIEKLEFASEEITVSVGSTFRPDYRIIPENANYTDMTAQVSEPLIEVNEDLSFYANEAGDSELSFYQDDKLLGTCLVHAEVVEIEDVTISEAPEEIVIGETLDLPFKLSPAKATNKGITVTSSNTNIAETEFDERGESVVHVIGKAAGEATITITIPNGSQYTHTITVKEIMPTELTVRNMNPNRRIEVGIPIELEVDWTPEDTSVKEVTWTSSNNNVVRLDHEGNFQAAGVGEAVITATHKSGVSGSITLKVQPTLANTIRIETNKDDSKKFYVGNSFNIYTTVLPENATDKTVTFTSSNESVIKVNQWGAVTAVGPGSAYVTIASADGPSKRLNVNVSEAPTPEPAPGNAQWNNSNTSGNSGTSNFQTYNEAYTGNAVYVGNASSKIFHYPNCSSVKKMATYNRVDLYSREDAIAKGYKPCGRCNP